MNNITSSLQNSINKTGINQNLEPKQPTKIFKNQPQADAQTDKTTKQALDSIDKLVNKVVNDLQSASNLNQTSKILQMAKDTKIAPNIAKDISNLANAIQNDENIQNNQALKDLALQLKEFLKPIADIKSAPLQEQLKSSGIMLEANLKEALNTQKIPNSIQKLLSDIKNLSNQNLLNQILNLANDESLNDNSSFVKLNQILKSEETISQNILNSSNLKALMSDVDKLDNISRYIDKLNFNQNLNGDKIQKHTASIDKFLSNLNDKISKFDNEKLNQITAFNSNLKELKNIIKDIQNSLKDLGKIGDEAGLIKAYNSLSSNENQTISEKLKSAARRLGVSLSIADIKASGAKTNLNEIKALQKQLNIASNDIINISSKTSSEMIPAQDIKSTLLAIADKSNTLNNATSIKDMSLKMLSQIELHQIVSSVSGGMQTYLPYIWDGVDDTSISIKHGKKDRFYAQIDLNFKQHGQVNIMLGLSNKHYLDLSIATSKNEFKELILENSSELKSSIAELGLVISNFNIKVLSKDEIRAKFKDFEGLEVGLNRKV